MPRSLGGSPLSSGPTNRSPIASSSPQRSATARRSSGSASPLPLAPDGYALEAAAVARRVLRDRQADLLTFDHAVLTLAGVRDDERLAVARMRALSVGTQAAAERADLDPVRARRLDREGTSWLRGADPGAIAAHHAQLATDAASARSRFDGGIEGPADDELAELVAAQEKDARARQWGYGNGDSEPGREGGGKRRSGEGSPRLRQGSVWQTAAPDLSPEVRTFGVADLPPDDPRRRQG